MSPASMTFGSEKMRFPRVSGDEPPSQANPGRFPRVSGDEPYLALYVGWTWRFSPRERG